MSHFPKELASIIAEKVNYDGFLPSKEEFETLFLSLSDLTKSKKTKLNHLLENYDMLKSNFEIMKLNVHTDIDYPYLKENPILPNFPQGIMSIYRTIKALDNG